MRLFCVSLIALACSAADLFIPAGPPRESYTIECRIDPAAHMLQGNESIQLTNTTQHSLERLPVQWTRAPGQHLSVTVDGKPLEVRDGLLELATALPPGQTIELHASFLQHIHAESGRPLLLQKWHPRLWWGFPTHADYAVKLDVPATYAIATSGRLDATGWWRAGHVREFGLYLAEGMRAEQAPAGDTLVRTLHTAKGAPCAALLLRTAVDAVNFYRRRFGFFPIAALQSCPAAMTPSAAIPWPPRWSPFTARRNSMPNPTPIGAGSQRTKPATNTGWNGCSPRTRMIGDGS